MAKYNKQYTGKMEFGVFDIKESIKNFRIASGPYKGEQFNINNTHTVAFRAPDFNDGKWCTFAHKKMREGYDLVFQNKDGNDYKDVWNGSEVNFWYGESTPNAEGKVFINIEYKSFRVLEYAECDQKVYCFGDKKGGGETSGGTPAPAYNPIGAIKGNAFKCTNALLGGKIDSPKWDAALLACKKLNEDLQAEFDFPGVIIGLCLQEACLYSKTIAAAEAWARLALEKQAVMDKLWDGTKPDAPKTETPEPDPEPDTPDADIPDDDLPF